MPCVRSIRTLLAAVVASVVVPLAACASGGSAAQPSSAQEPGGAAAGSTSFALVAGPGFISSTQFDRSSTCDNPGDYSPGLSFQWIPQGTAQLALTMVDIDIDKVHWIQLIPSTVTGIAQHHLATGGTELRNDFGEATYDGPCPPRGSTHHYVLTLSALPSKYIATAGADPHAAISGIGQLAFATTSLMVTYARS